MNVLDTPILPINIFLRSSEYTTSNNESSYKSNILFELNKPILSFPNMDTLIKLESFQFTNSFYCINEYNCNFYFSYDLTTYQIITVPIGNYDIDSLIKYFNSLYNGFTFSYNDSTYKIKIINSTPFILFNAPNNIYEVLGFDDFGTSELVSTITAPYLFNLMGVQVLHVCVNNINLNSYGLKNKTKHNILSSIHVTAPVGETQTFYNGFTYQIGYEPLTSLNITIYNQDFNIINFNNIDWFLNISFNFIYKKIFNIPQYLDTIDGESNMGYYLQEEQQKNINYYLDNIIQNKK